MPDKAIPSLHFHNGGKMNRALRSIASGLAGAGVLTLIHETARRTISTAPHMQVIGERAITAGLGLLGRKPPPPKQLLGWAMFADVVTNAPVYALIGAGGRDGVWRRGALLGAGIGVSGLVLPPLLGLGYRPQARTPETAAMTVGWYLAGGLAAAAAFRLLSPPLPPPLLLPDEQRNGA